jgi:hypothetical protein
MKFKPSATGPKPRSAQSHSVGAARGPAGVARAHGAGAAHGHAGTARDGLTGGAARWANGDTAPAHGRRPRKWRLTGAGTAARRDGDGRAARRPGWHGGSPGDAASDRGAVGMAARAVRRVGGRCQGGGRGTRRASGRYRAADATRGCPDSVLKARERCGAWKPRGNGTLPGGPDAARGVWQVGPTR